MAQTKHTAHLPNTSQTMMEARVYMPQRDRDRERESQQHLENKLARHSASSPHVSVSSALELRALSRAGRRPCTTCCPLAVAVAGAGAGVWAEASTALEYAAGPLLLLLLLLPSVVAVVLSSLRLVLLPLVTPSRRAFCWS